jgi:hypothetical protein
MKEGMRDEGGIKNREIDLGSSKNSLTFLWWNF